MKYLFFLAWNLLIFSHCQSQISKMSLSLQITHTEKSKDSHSRTENWHLKDNKLTYQQSFDGRLSGKKPVKKEAKLSPNQLEEIANLLKENDLYKNIPSPKYSEFHIPYSAINVYLIHQKGNESFDIQLYDLAKNIPENRDYQHITLLTDLLNQYLK